MKWYDVVQITKDRPYFSEAVLSLGKENTAALRNQLTSWVKKGRIHRLKKGLYTLSESDRRFDLHPLLVSNILYAPSYVSLEYMLSYYGLIPEKVHQMTAVTSRKTALFQNPIGSFSYRHMKEGLFCGFLNLSVGDHIHVLAATPEKALLDKIYLDGPLHPTREYFEEGLRLQNMDSLHVGRLAEMAKHFGSHQMKEVSKIISEWKKKGWR